MSQPHLERAIRTMNGMRTDSDDWYIPVITWLPTKIVEELPVPCSNCKGEGVIAPSKDGRPAHRCPKECKIFKKYWNENLKSMTTGNVFSLKKMVEREVYISKVEWNQDIIFDSRFKKTGHNCELCANPIKNRDNYVPVEARGNDGKFHGMWIGRDCAQNFLKLALTFEPEENHRMMPDMSYYEPKEATKSFVLKEGAKSLSKGSIIVMLQPPEEDD